ncbi:HAD-IB family hydrolase [Streptomyces sp. NPDC045431]|uniref:HAD family hydrolase n=1 Tax=Streptomyces sp. NPDC045431 TaxID=3155613 RepID=UPI0033E3DA4E
MSTTHKHSVLAFFDVDETLITGKSMLGLLDHHFGDTGGRGRPPAAVVRAELFALRAAGAARADLNRAFFRRLRGHRERDLMRSGRAWFEAELARGDLFHPPVRAALDRHRAARHTIVLLSGSFAACLDPIARHVAADRTVCTMPEVRRGVLTGEVDAPVIGEEKARRVRRLMHDLGAQPQDCFAYGDDAGDIDVLRAVGHATVVGDDPVLRAWALRTGRPRLPGVYAEADAA